MTEPTPTISRKSANRITRLLALLNYFFAATAAFMTFAIVLILISISVDNRELIQRVDSALDENQQVLEELREKYEK